ncbi:MAG: hypothetical protein COB67_07085 [SAR324 cluster bacterium]|uniref:Rhodanese domain-containing protein n=1 Tax=SAR324 cluster bacterium TaxID=2024889 RepID=A0A2A4T447_9DELT|nr:MAG: hypothetical protein COB67_07085 [SAR324 cluster bacterium]
MKFTNKNVFEASEFVQDSLELLQLRRGNMPPIVIDLRSAVEYQEEHLAGANNLPAEFLEDNLMQLPPFAKIIVYGGDDDTKAHDSVKLLRDQGFSDISFVEGGLNTILSAIRSSDDEIFLGDIPEEEWHVKIEEVLDQKIRAALASDGGGMEVLKIDGNKVYIAYHGACNGCASSTAGTLRFIQTTLSVALNYDIEVITT